ncbi:MAG: ABC-type dipeptide/oligopeptide/nickel transport system, permease component [Acidimicrobiales bacterium]|jgi:peptide/nickel transport system permease protein|nr:ABC-type dipeptide/oligopeptide/nickel transport system, permease component [Acidimicrobiales bacterium]
MPPDLPTDVAVAPEVIAVVAGAPSRRTFGVGAWLAVGWLVLVIGLALLAPLLPIPKPSEIIDHGALRDAKPSLSHLLGGDDNSYDLFSRIVWGARNSLAVGFFAVAIGGTVGGFLGLIAGYYRGRIETLITAVLDIMLAFPALVLALALTTFLGHSLFYVSLALGIISTPILARITRANTLTWSQREFVTAARAQGAKNRRIIVREVLPNVVPAMASIALLAVAVVIVAEAGLSLLGAGLKVDVPSWGNIITFGRSGLTNGQAPHIVFSGSGAIFFTVLSLNYLGDVVRARFDVKEGALT